jgi:hypothetical protein
VEELRVIFGGSVNGVVEATKRLGKERLSHDVVDDLRDDVLDRGGEECADVSPLRELLRV